MDKPTRNLIFNTTQAIRRLLEEEFALQLEGTFDVHRDGRVAEQPGPQLTPAERLVRQRIVDAIRHRRAVGEPDDVSVRGYLSEAVFTFVNRLAALKMMEARGLLLPCVSQGDQSQGFKEFCGLAPGLIELPDRGYRLYLECLFDEIGREVGVLFDRTDSASQLWPRRKALEAALEKLNVRALAGVWVEDETIGWIYQYYNDPEERKKMRDESSAPRNSRELAVRNQFFTPRYVVEFLTDNTLGRIWYEMTQGDTKLKEQCRYLVRRPHEIFLNPRYLHLFEGIRPWVKDVASGHFHAGTEDATWDEISTVALMLDGYELAQRLGLGELFDWANPHLEAAIEKETVPPLPLWELWLLLFACQRGYLKEGLREEDDKTAKGIRRIWEAWCAAAKGVQPKQDNPSQEDLLRAPVHIPHRPLKDPRTILMIDPACGSMHFGLYAFDLFEVIYDEAWEMAERIKGEGRSIQELEAAYPQFSSFILHTSSFGSKDAFLKDVPRLIIEHNLHGIDIDPRCAQIAGLSLWLRAQKAWQRLGLKPAERPAIKRSNIVCAEPMPGEKELLREFVEREFPVAERAVCLRLLEAIFDKMQLAGEAGSLLKIEEEIRSAIEDARDAWQKLTTRPPELFTTTELHQLSTAPELTGLEQAVSSLTTDPRHLTTDFWERIEERIYAALRDYAEQAENGGGFQRRLFAEDAARGFAFIDVCRKRYDVALMNPPFGEPSVDTKSYIFDRYPVSKYDLAATFADRARALTTRNGISGSLTNRSIFFGQMLEEWRRWQFGSDGSLSLFGDLGVGVLDGALVEAVAYTFSSAAEREPALFFKTTEKGLEIDEMITHLRQGTLPSDVYVIFVRTFQAIPECPFAYWTPEESLQAYARFKALEDYGVVVKQGMESSDNFRFVRLWWEVAADNSNWKPYSKGGSFGPQWRDIDVVINWGSEGKEVKEFSGSLFGTWTKQITNTAYYGLPGLWYPKSRVEFSPRILPANCVVGCVGPIVAFEPSRSNSESTYIALLAILCSSACRALVNLNTTSGNPSRKSYREGAVARVPIPDPDGISEEVRVLTRTIVALIRDFESSIECYRLFVKIPQQTRRGELATVVRSYREKLDELVCRYFGFRGPAYGTFEKTGYDDFQESELLTPDEILSFHLGVAYGRWDIRYATGEQAAPELPDPFAPLPVCPPGQLQNAQGLPLGKDEVGRMKDEGGWDYPIEIPWDGILVDDPNHPLDLERRVREVIEIIWSGQEGGPTAEAIEHEACEILGVKSVRDYFRKPAGFFADHLKRYSKSRRQAPIYWPLSSPKNLYTVWLYYHRLTPDTLFTILRDHVKPKLEYEERRAFQFRQEAGPTPSPSQRQDIAGADELVEDLRAFRDELNRVAPLFRPNLNDGVIINHAPLWRLAGHSAWQAKLKECWKALVDGDYDWAHLALHLWPGRVIPNCATDRSLAIAHGLDEFFWEEIPWEELDSAKPPKKPKKTKPAPSGDAKPPAAPEEYVLEAATSSTTTGSADPVSKPMGTGKWRPKKVPEAEVQKLIADRTSPAVEAALESLGGASASEGAGRRGRKRGST